MRTIFEELMADRLADGVAVSDDKVRMRRERTASVLRQLREAQNLTQADLAELLYVSQERVSAIERGELARAQIDTLRRYVRALGGELCVEVHLNDERIQIG